MIKRLHLSFCSQGSLTVSALSLRYKNKVPQLSTDSSSTRRLVTHFFHLTLCLPQDSRLGIRTVIRWRRVGSILSLHRLQMPGGRAVSRHFYLPETKWPFQGANHFVLFCTYTQMFASRRENLNDSQLFL